MHFIKLNNRILQLLGIILIGIVIIYGHSVLVPIGFSFIFSITLLPAYRLIKRTKLPDSIAILLTLLFAFIILGVVVGVISMQISHLLSNIDSLKVTPRIPNLYPDGGKGIFPVDYHGYFECVDSSRGKVIGWKESILDNPQCRR